MKMINLDGVQIEVDNKAIESFKNLIQGLVLSEHDPGYDEARVIFNGMFDIKPSLIVQTESVADVICCVNFARNHNILLSIRGGGHNVAGKALCEGGITIDLRRMNEVDVDVENLTVRVGGGALLGDMDKATQQYGFSVPAGIVSDTGVAGLTLGGGFGWIRAKYGLSIDNLLSVDIVTANGQLLHASESENEDLFWAVRGGSGNFGVVTTFQFRLRPVGPEVMFSGPIYSTDNAKELLKYWKEFMDKAPDEYTGMLILMTLPELDIYPKEIHGKDAIMFGGVYCGDIQEGEEFVKPLREMDNLLFDMSGIKKYTEIQTMFDPPFPNGSMICYFTSLYVNKFDDQVIDTLITSLNDRPAKLIPLVVQDLSGASMRVPNDKTAFGDRSAPYLIELNSAWLDQDESDYNISWTREYMDKFRKFSAGATYLNHSGLNEEGEELVKRTYGANYEKLRQIKKKYDPTNLFRVNQNITPG